MKNNKIGTITFHKAINYGAVLQTYALQKALINEGINTEVINYTNNKIDNSYKLFHNKSIKKIISDVIYFFVKMKKKKKFNKFINDNIILSEECKSFSDLEKIETNYDMFITGSDQVWNSKHTGMDEGYFLKFVKNSKKKNSYAASFGFNEIPEGKQEIYTEMLKEFNNISVREKNGINIINSLIKPNCDVEIHLDPTFLIDKEDWNKIAKIPKETDYILVFVMQKNKTIFEFAEKLAKETGKKIIYISDSFKKRIKAKYKYTLSPEEWLGYFINANYIVTNSFHGAAFSIILNKKFYMELQKPPATANSRLEDLLEKFGLQDRKIVNGENAVRTDIRWEYVNNIINEEKNKSINYLRKIEKEGKNINE